MINKGGPQLGMLPTLTDDGETPGPISAGVSVRLMGGFAVEARGRAVSLPHSVARLVVFLALSRAPVRRSLVAGALWLDATEARARANLRSALWRLGQSGLDMVVDVNGSLQYADSVEVDVWDLADAARCLLDPAHDDIAIRVEDLTLELLPDWYEDWVLFERERFRQLRLHALESLARRLMRAGRFGEAAEAAMAAVGCEVLRESAHRVVIEVFLAEGNPSEAIRHYHLFRKVLDEELGLVPSDAMERLVGELTEC